jgi:hypothetical protein
MTMRKLKLDLDALAVESFAPSKSANGAGTVRGYLTAYYELCYPDQTWEQSCTCEPTCNAQTCYQCASAACPTNDGAPACTGTCYPVSGRLSGCDWC